MLGTGFPDALHSKVMDPPLRALSCPLDGDIRMLGGTTTKGEREAFSAMSRNHGLPTEGMRIKHCDKEERATGKTELSKPTVVLEAHTQVSGRAGNASTVLYSLMDNQSEFVFISPATPTDLIGLNFQFCSVELRRVHCTYVTPPDACEKNWNKESKKKEEEKQEIYKIKLLEEESIQDLYKRRLRDYTNAEEPKEEIEEEWQCIRGLLHKTAKEVLGTKKVGGRQKGLKKWDPEIQKLVSDKKEAYLKYLNNKNDQNKIEYNRARALVKRYTRKLNREHWENYIAEMEHNLHGSQDKVYKFIRSLNSQEKDKTNLIIIQDIELENYYKKLWTDKENEEETIGKKQTVHRSR
ncbi:hypothetical protein ANN_09393 [Periplaneta americana]|uniref:Uncharacterized protein n=1 Tax=Periplaneta americana TaxID=6978 RepID=A0ABQ8TLK7_PERAM|nr:hypothetical protein ANN_09393 [Periplaneta americana]